MSTLERHPDDLPPPDLPHPGGRRRLPRGIGWAVALAAVVITIAVVVLGGADTSEPATDGPVPPPTTVDAVGDAAPDRTFERFDGTTGSLADYRGRPVVVNFWSSTCVPCLTEMPAFEEVHGELGDDVAFLGLNVADGPDRGRRMAERTGVTYDLARDPSGAIAVDLGSTTLPTTAIIDADGTVVDVHVGAMDAGELRAALGAVR